MFDSVNKGIRENAGDAETRAVEKDGQSDE